MQESIIQASAPQLTQINNYITFQPADSIISVSQIFQSAQLSAFPQLRQSLIASIHTRNQQMQQLNPNYINNPIKEEEIDFEGLQQIEQKIGQTQDLQDIRELEKSSVILQSGLFSKKDISKEKQGYLLKKSKSILNTYKKIFCTYKDGIFSIYKTKNSSKAKIVLNFHLFNFRYFSKQRYNSIEEFGLKCEDDNKEFFFKGEEATSWFQVIKKVIEEQRKSPKYQYYIKSFPDYYKKHLIHNKQFLEMAQSGDIMLFQSKCMASKLQRILTRSQYDHVAMVLKYANGQIYILEATGTMGVGIFSWKNMIEKLWYELYNMVVYRQLILERSSEFLKDLENFVKENLGKQYKLSVSKLLADKSVIIGKDQPQQDQTYFCSQLIAQVFKKTGLLETELSATQFWPGSFSNEKDNLKLKGDASLSDEYLIGFNM